MSKIQDSNYMQVKKAAARQLRDLFSRARSQRLSYHALYLKLVEEWGLSKRIFNELLELYEIEGLIKVDKKEHVIEVK